MDAFWNGRVSEPDRRRGSVAAGTIVARVYPQPRLSRFACTWGQHIDGCVIRMQLGRTKNVALQRIKQGAQSMMRATDPAAPRAFAHNHVLAPEALHLGVQRVVV